ncbi:MAG TPA: sulfite reductase [Gammaproteobacteria bacterium]|nr:sulfite reductase [Gammaproteobacteria bacterium]
MSESIIQHIHPASASNREILFPYAPEGWTSADAEAQAEKENIIMEEAHWRTVIALQEYYANHEHILVRELHDALDEKFHIDGGIRFLYTILPGGPIAQGCRLAGLHAPAGSADPSFGSVQ